jgi:hypothetical protein
MRLAPLQRRKEIFMRAIAIAVLVLTSSSLPIGTVQAQQKDACKVCGDQQRACMKNYAGLMNGLAASSKHRPIVDNICQAVPRTFGARASSDEMRIFS